MRSVNAYLETQKSENVPDAAARIRINFCNHLVLLPPSVVVSDRNLTVNHAIGSWILNLLKIISKILVTGNSASGRRAGTPFVSVNAFRGMGVLC